MLYKLLENRLRVTKDLARKNKKLLSGSKILLLQHLFDDTLEFVEYLTENGASIHRILGKSYSVDELVLNSLKSSNIPVEIVDFKRSETDPKYLLNILIDALKSAKKESKKLIVHEVGGFFSEAINSIPPSLSGTFAGVVEDTTFGYNRYKALEPKLRFPVFHVARSQLKEVEAVFVGEAIVLAFNNMMRSVGISIPGRKALVIGYGMIGKNVAKYLKSNNVDTTVFDIEDLNLLHAFTHGHKVIHSIKDLSQFDAIFSATGTTSIKLKHMKTLKDGVILASGGSQDVEFDIKNLRLKANNTKALSPEIKAYTLNNKQIIVLSEGTPINFREKSVPTEVIDIVYSEILYCILELLRRKHSPRLHEITRNGLNKIAKSWLTNLE